MDSKGLIAETAPPLVVRAFVAPAPAALLIAACVLLAATPARAACDPSQDATLTCAAPCAGDSGGSSQAGPLEIETPLAAVPGNPVNPPPASTPTPDLGPALGPGPAPGSPFARSPALSLPRSDLVVSSPPDKPYWRSNIFKRALTDQKFLVTQWWPSELKRWGFTGPLLAATALAAGSTDDENAIDFRAERHVDEGSGRGTDAIAMGFTRLGNGVPASMALGLTYLLARRAGNDRLAEASSLSFEALLSTGLWVEILKETAARQRPSQGSNGKFFQYGGRDTNSFPSGHSMGAFTVATVFAHVYADKKWVPWVAYGTAGLIGASRVALGRHYPSDVIAGAVLGNSIGRMVLARDGREGPLAPGRFRPIFDPSKRAVGVGYSYSW